MGAAVDLTPAELIGACSSVPLAAVWLWLSIIGKIHYDGEFQAERQLRKQRETELAEKDKEIASLRGALADERQAVNEQAVTGVVTTKVLSAFLALGAERNGLPAPPEARPQAWPQAKDVGI